MNTEERQLTEMLHRVTPEPPGQVTVEDIAFRLASQAGPGRGPRYRERPYREPRLRRPRMSRAWAPALAAASVFVVAGASAGIAVLASSHHTPAPSSQGTLGATSASPASSSTSTPASTSPVMTAVNAPWGGRLIDHLALTQASLTGSGDSLYAFTPQDLVRIDPATGAVVRSVPVRSAVLNSPVVLGGKVWVVSAYAGGRVVLQGYDAQSLALVTSAIVPTVGQVSTAAAGVLTAGPDGNLYVAAGDIVAVVNPASGAVVQRIQQAEGPVGSVAVSPEGSMLYVSTFVSSGQTFQLRTYNLAEGDVQVGSSSVSEGAGGSLVATSGGVWGTLGSGMSQWVWFAAGGDLSSASPVTRGAGGGYVSLPALTDGAIWIGGSQTLACADPATGSVRAKATIPGDHGDADYVGSVAYAGGHAYAYYIDSRSGTQGVITLNPPAACAS